MEVMRREMVYTVEDIYRLPEGKRAELIDGQIYLMAPPNTRHQRLLNYLATEINMYIRKNKGECEVFPAPFAVFLNADDRNYVEPDLSVICDKDKITDKGCNGAPDWTIEIVSPGSKQMDYYRKLLKYKMTGVREYWVTDPEREIVTVYNFEKDEMTEYPFGDEVPVGIYEGFSIKVQ